MAAPDRAEIRRACALLFEPGDVVELRALDAVSPSWRRPHTVAGYFDDFEKLADAAQLRARGVYVTLNRLRPELLARARNRVKDLGAGDPTTSDGDVTLRRWLPIDCDPVRPAGISASAPEHELALARARTIRDHLAGLGWPAPILADSGNGGHLLYRVELPAADSGLLARVLAALAFLFDDAVVTVDQVVANPARIWKLYGTVARKGEDDPERPHRPARILEAPDALTPVPPDLLQALAGIVPAEPRAAPRTAAFDLPRWLAEHGVPAEGPRPWSSGERWILPICPWNPDHRRSAYIVRFPSGAVAAGCHHNSCRSNDWHALRDLFDPDWRRAQHELPSTRRPGEQPPVAHGSAQQATSERSTHPDPNDRTPLAGDQPSANGDLPPWSGDLLAELATWQPAVRREERTALEARAAGIVSRAAHLGKADLLRAAGRLRALGCTSDFTRRWMAAALDAGRNERAAGADAVPTTTGSPYVVHDGRIYRRAPGSDDAADGGPGPVVADFVARIVEEARGEDGRTWFAIVGRTAEGRAFSLEIAAEEFADDRLLKAALTCAAGARAAIRAGMTPHLRPAIQLLPGEVRQVRRYDRAGWGTDAAGNPRFLIPGREPEGAVVRLPRRLPYRLDPDACLAEGLEALRAALNALEPWRTTLVAAAVFQAPLARLAGWLDERYGVFIAGRSGSLKTSLAQALMAIYGAGFLQDELLLKLGEGATRNAILGYAAQAHDLPLLLDNFKPNTGDGSRGLVNLVHNLLEGGDRERLSRDAELKEGRPIHCFPIFTGEDVPAGDPAGLARLLVVPFEWERGPDGDNPELAKAQRLATHLPAVGRSWLAWLETETGQAAARDAAARFPQERRQWAALLHRAGRDMVNPARVASNLATNALTWEVVMQHPDLGPLAAEFAEAHKAGLANLAGDMAARTAQALEAARFLETLRGLLAAGRCVLVPRSGGQAADPKAPAAQDPSPPSGRQARAATEAKRGDPRSEPPPERDAWPSGRGLERVVGWEAADGGAYLEPALARRAVEEVLGPDALNRISMGALYAQLNALGLIAGHDPGRLTTKLRIGAITSNVLHLAPKALALETSAGDEAPPAAQGGAGQRSQDA